MSITKQHLESPSGFSDWSPDHAMALYRLLAVIEGEYEAAGYTPIVTPIIERVEILAAKAEGQIKNQVYGLRLLNPSGDSPRDETALALRFDHTVPLARYVAANHGAMRFPFRRRATGPVIRGERPKDGRYREFIQADVDVIGLEKLSFDHDAEMISIIWRIFDKLAFGPFTIRINNRKVLMGLMRAMGFESEAACVAATKALDDLDKIGTERTVQAMIALGVDEAAARSGLKLLAGEHSEEQAFARMRERERERDLGPDFAEGVAELQAVTDAIRAFGVPQERYRVDFSVARGLDYYTSTVFEARLDAYPSLGSIAGGGRYDNLASIFSDKMLPGVGVSIGVTRLLRRLIKLGIVKADAKSVATVLLASDNYLMERAVHLERARRLREAGIQTEVYLEHRRLGTQIGFASKQGIQIVVFSAPRHLENSCGRVIVRNLRKGAQVDVPENDMLEAVRSMLTTR